MQFKRSLTIILGVLFAIILMYLWYTQFYIKSREKQLIETHYRVLDQVGENLKARIFSYIKNARNLQKAMEENDREIDSLNLKKNQFETLKGNDAVAGPSFVDSLNSYEEKIKIKIEFYNNYTKVYNADFKNIKHVDKMTGDTVFVRKDSLVIAIKDYLFFVPLEFLLKNIDRKDIFENSIILDTSSIIYSSFARDIRLDFIKSENVGKNQKGGFFNISPEITIDTLYLPGSGSKKAATIHGSRSYNITLSDGNFKLFLKPVRIEDLNWFIGGLVDQKDFQRSVRSIAPGFIIILSIVLLLVMVSLPFVKLKVMSKTEMLGTGTVVYAGLAFFLGASFLILFLFFKAYNLSSLKETDEKLVALSDTISRA